MGRRGIEILTLDKDELLLNEGLEHEQDIEDWITDLERMKEGLRKFRME